MLKVAPPPQVNKPAAATAGGKIRFGAITRQVLWFLGSVLVSLCLLESIFSLAHAGQEEYLAADPILGSTHLAGQMVTFRSEGYSRQRINSAGFRDYQYPLEKPPRTLRVAVLGDSVTEGLQVPLADTFAKRLESRLIAAYGNHFQVLNFAMSGYGTGQEYVQLLHQVSKYQPDMVLLMYQVGDSDDNVLPSGVAEPIPRPYFSLNSKRQLQIDWSVLNNWWLSDRGRWFQFSDWLRQNSRVAGVLSRLQLSLNADKSFQSWRKATSGLIALVLKNQPVAPVSTAILNRQMEINRSIVSSRLDMPVKQLSLVSRAEPQFAMYAQAAEANWQLTAEIIKQINQYCRARQCQLVVAGLPAPNNCLFYFRELRQLEKLSRQEGFRFINIHAKFPPRAPLQKSPYYLDYHLSKQGHKQIAEQIYAALWPN